jgi:6-pyruvoyltetrahydropterin/6-carboxytetrahydropterin synthase
MERQMYTIAKRFKFEAAHRLEGLPEGHQCGRLHGHSYTVEVAIWSRNLADEGWIKDFAEFKPFKVYLDDQFDHQFLNDVLGGMQTTSENLARHFFETFDLVVALPLDVSIKYVRVSETETSYAEYSR